MREFSYLDFKTEYSCKGFFDTPLLKGTCFNIAFNKLSHLKHTINEQYEIILYRSLDYLRRTHYSNYCVLSKRQLSKHLQQARDIFQFDFKINNIKVYDISAFKVTLILNKKCPLLFHKYLLTWLRYTYEFPFNVLLLDAYKLKKESRFRYTSIVNLFNVILTGFRQSSCVHSITQAGVNCRLKKSQIRTQLTKIEKLNDLYKVLTFNYQTFPKSVQNKGIEDIEYWEDNDIYERFRKPIYIKTYLKTLKEK